MEGRATLPNVVVDARKVQESGLLKDTINLDVPDEVGDFSTVLLRRATKKLQEISVAWDGYAENENLSNKVAPLMVLQVPNSPDTNEIGTWLKTIFDTWSDLTNYTIANVFGEHRTETFGNYTAPYISPERVQDAHWIRLLVAKDAISSGWDCPRAEVMVSLRPARDKTHITQLLGRMVRTPLARRIPGNERLNAVDCLLPHFSKTTVEAVVTELMTGGGTGEELPGRRVLINPQEMTPNPKICEAVWERLLSLPSQSLPKRESRPVKQLTALAHELAADGLLDDAGKIAHSEMHRVLDGASVRYADEIKKARAEVLKAEGKTVKADVKTKEMTFDDFVEVADYAVIEDAYRRAGRLITPDLARTYSEHLASQVDKALDIEDALIEAHTDIAAIGLVPQIKDDLEREAKTLSNQWLDKYRVKIRSLNDERQDVYREIKEMSADPLDVDLARPKKWLQPTTVRGQDGSEKLLPCFELHLLCDANGLFPSYFDSWEEKILHVELQREDTVAWYRNPARASQDSLGVTYVDGNDTKIVRPDFIFFARLDDESIVADIIDPHSYHLADALPKLKGLADYAERNGAIFRRIETVAELNGVYKVLDLQEKNVREAVRSATNAKSLYESAFAVDYEV